MRKKLPAKFDNRPKAYPIGKLSSQETFYFNDEDLSRHVAVIGKTGCGKTSFCFELLKRKMHYHGFTLLDPKDDFKQDLMSVIAYEVETNKNDALADRIVDLTPGPESIVGFDFCHVPKDLSLPPRTSRVSSRSLECL